MCPSDGWGSVSHNVFGCLQYTPFWKVRSVTVRICSIVVLNTRHVLTPMTIFFKSGCAFREHQYIILPHGEVVGGPL